MNPDFIIIGAQKAATTFLQSCLRDHPDVFMPKGETTFFESPDYELANGDIANLHELFEGRSEKHFGIKRPNYIGKPEVPARIEHHLPDAKLIAVLRKPLDRAISAYHHNINLGFIPPIDIEEGMRLILTKKSFSEKYKRASEIIEFGYYYKYLNKYSHYINNKQLLILLHEDIIFNKLEAIKKVYKYLDVDVHYIPKSINTKPQAIVYNMKRQKYLRIKNHILYEYHLDRTRISLKKCNIIRKIIVWPLVIIDMKILSVFFRNNKPEISTDLRYMLYDKYKKDIESLETLFNINLINWKTLL